MDLTFKVKSRMNTEFNFEDTNKDMVPRMAFDSYKYKVGKRVSHLSLETSKEIGFCEALIQLRDWCKSNPDIVNKYWDLVLSTFDAIPLPDVPENKPTSSNFSDYMTKLR